MSYTSAPIWQQEKIDRHFAAAKLLPFGISYLDDALGGIAPNDLIVIGARTGSGKTELATFLAEQAASRAVSVAFFALEADRWEIHRRLKYRKLSQIFFKHYASKMPGFQWPRYSDWLNFGFDRDLNSLEDEAEMQLVTTLASLQVIYPEGEMNAEQFAKLVETLSESDVKLFILDHLHYFDWGNENEMTALRKATRTLRRVALQIGKPIVCIAHLRKSDRKDTNPLPTIDDFHGHSDIVKIATQVILMAPAEDAHNALGKWPTYFHIAKARRAGEVKGYVATLGFNPSENKYGERYLLSKYSRFEAPKQIEGASEVPKWAKRAEVSSRPIRSAKRSFHDDYDN